MNQKYLSHGKLLQSKLDLLKQVAVSGRQKLVKDLEHPEGQDWSKHDIINITRTSTPLFSFKGHQFLYYMVGLHEFHMLHRSMLYQFYQFGAKVVTLWHCAGLKFKTTLP